jgi:hypothetical protein
VVAVEGSVVVVVVGALEIRRVISGIIKLWYMLG